MKDGIKLNMHGVKQLNELFEQLKTGAKKSILISAFRQASKPIIASAKSNLSGLKSSANLRKSLGNASHARLPILFIGARKNKGYKGHLGHIINDGTVERSYVTKWGKKHKTGKIKGNHFWDNAVNSNRTNVENTIENEVFESFERYIMKYNSKNKD